MRPVKISCRQINRAAQGAVLRKVKGVRQYGIVELGRDAVGMLEIGEFGVVRKPDVVKIYLFAKGNIIEIGGFAENGIGEVDIVGEGSVGEYSRIHENAEFKNSGIPKTGVLIARLGPPIDIPQV